MDNKHTKLTDRLAKATLPYQKYASLISIFLIGMQLDGLIDIGWMYIAMFSVIPSALYFALALLAPVLFVLFAIAAKIYMVLK